MEQVAELLEKAADALESGRITWGQYSPFNCAKQPGTYCAYETLIIESQGHRGHLMVTKAAGAMSLHVTKGRGANHLPAWNDAPGRTLSEVVEAFKETAKKIRNGEQ